MPIIDELVTLLRYELDPKAKKNLEAAENAPAKITKNSEKLAKSFEKTGDSFTKTAGMIATGFQAIALSAAGAVAAGAGFALYSANESKNLKDLSDELDINAQDLSEWSAAIRSSGGNARAFFNDLKGLQDMYGGISLDEVLRDADTLSKMSLPEAMHQGKGWGYSAGSVRFLHRGSEEIQKALEEVRRLGQALDQDVIEKQAKLSESFSKVTTTLSGLYQNVAGEFAEPMTDAINSLTNALGENKDTIRDWAAAARDEFTNFVDSVTSKLGQAENAISNFNKRPAAENAHSPDPEVRQKEIAEREKKAFWQSVWLNAGVVYDTTKTLGGMAYDLGAGAVTLDPGRMYDAIDNAVGEYTDRLWDTANKQKAITDPLFRALVVNDDMTRDPNRHWMQMQAEMHAGMQPKQLSGDVIKVPNIRSLDQLAAFERSEGYTARLADTYRGMEEGEFQPGGRTDNTSSAAIKFPNIRSLDQLAAFERSQAKQLNQIPVSPRPDPYAAAPQPYSGGRAGQSGGNGVTVENQNVTINVNGAGDPEAVGKYTAEALDYAATHGDYGTPFFR